jgi:hypothetical protein
MLSVSNLIVSKLLCLDPFRTVQLSDKKFNFTLKLLENICSNRLFGRYPVLIKNYEN